MSEIKKSAAELIGETPILEISRYSQSAGVKDVTILAKLRVFKPGGRERQNCISHDRGCRKIRCIKTGSNDY